MREGFLVLRRRRHVLLAFLCVWGVKLSVLWNCGILAEQVDLGALKTFGVRQQYSNAI